MSKATQGRRNRGTEIVGGKIEVRQERPGGEVIRQGARETIILEIQTSKKRAIGKVEGQATRELIRVQAKGIEGVQEAKGLGRDKAKEGFTTEMKLGDTLRGRI